MCTERERMKCSFRFVVGSCNMQDDDGEEIIVYDFAQKFCTHEQYQ